MQMIAQSGGLGSGSGCEAKKVKRTTLHQMVTLKKFLSTRSQPDKNELLKVFNKSETSVALLIDAVLTHCVLGTGKSFSFVEKNRVLRKESYYKDCSPGGPPPAGDWIKKKLHNFIQLLPAFTKYFWLLFHPIIFVESNCKQLIAKHHSWPRS